MKSVLYPLFLVLAFTSCADNHAAVFIRQFGREDFMDFRNTKVAVNGYDDDHLLILSLDMQQQHNPIRKSMYIVGIDETSGEIKKTSCHLMNGIAPDVHSLHRLAQKFLHYKAQAIWVDNNSNVFISLRDSRTATLVKYAGKDWSVLN
ncbi:MAG TPA: hypothetical protein VM802_23820 [Chitinophaga sp.]|uniref:hypothetical protein n=1 Tax=Chitinophaga sp. TaxID=1869181 RepID=UPI002BEE0FA7|nr:hypothetical protein [Chitinophaga sp.]HVI47917.1 hypothetical protein [Chitinophaga sp.]